jgi:hypothetical protein
MHVTVVICTRNPHPGRFSRVLTALREQDLAPEEWDLLVVDNGSTQPVPAPDWPRPWRARVITELRAGLFHARLAAIHSVQSPLIVFIDDDTIPHPACLRSLRDGFLGDDRLVAAGPRIHPEFLSPPPDWLPEFAWALALRDLGPEPLSWALSDGSPFPSFTPIGAGLALRREALPAYLAHARSQEAEICARSWIGQGKGGCEDKDLVLTLIRAGGRVAYLPESILHHIIPPERLEPAYFDRLLPGLNFLWMRTLHAHGLEEMSAIPPWTLHLRATRSWFRHRAWRRPAPRLRWLAALGLFRGLAANHPDRFRYPPPIITAG